MQELFGDADQTGLAQLSLPKYLQKREEPGAGPTREDVFFNPS